MKWLELISKIISKPKRLWKKFVKKEIVLQNTNKENIPITPPILKKKLSIPQIKDSIPKKPIVDVVEKEIPIVIENRVKIEEESKISEGSKILPIMESQINNFSLEKPITKSIKKSYPIETLDSTILQTNKKIDYSNKIEKPKHNIIKPNLEKKLKKSKFIHFKMAKYKQDEAIEKIKSSVLDFNIWRIENLYSSLVIYNADLSGLNLNEINFKGCILVKVNLSNSILTYSNFNDSILENVTLTGANILESDLSNVDISSVYGLNLNKLKKIPENHWFRLDKSYKDKLDFELIKQNFPKSINYTKIKQILELTLEAKSITELIDMSIDNKKSSYHNKGSFRNNLLRPLLNAGLIEMTIKENPRNPNQKYIITTVGKSYLESNNFIEGI